MMRTKTIKEIRTEDIRIEGNLELTESAVESLIELARKHAALIDRMQAALEADDTELALTVAREVCGLPPKPPVRRARKSARLFPTTKD